MLRLYDYLDSGNGYKARLLMSFLGTPYELVEIDILRGDSRTREFLAKNPNGKIPVLEIDDGTHLSESNAILFYLAEDTPFWPRERLERARVLQWMFFEQYSHEPNIATSRFWLRHTEVDDERRKALAVKRELGHAALRVMDEHLAGRRWFVGERMTVADVALYAYTHVADQGGFDLTPYANVRSWLGRIEGEPGYVPMLR